MAQGVDVGDRLTASGQHRGHIHPDLTTVVARDETGSSDLSMGDDWAASGVLIIG
jgi:hypothetical protein